MTPEALAIVCRPATHSATINAVTSSSFNDQGGRQSDRNNVRFQEHGLKKNYQKYRGKISDVNAGDNDDD